MPTRRRTTVLNATATCAWEGLVSAAATREDLSRRLSVCYGRDVNTLRSHVDALVAALAAESLIVGSPTPTGDTANASRPSDVLRSQNGYEPPALSRFGELEKLVLSGE